MFRRILIVLVAAVAVLAATPASAQSFGIGPQFSLVRGNVTSGTPTSNLIGGTMRFLTGEHTAIEASMDYRSYLNDAGTERTKETPMQGSLLLFLGRHTLSPYVAGGIGLYSQVHETLNSQGLVTATSTDKQVGWHLGAGAEIRIAPHAAFFADYRFRFVKWGSPTDPSQQPITIPGTTVVPVLSNIRLTHEGSMWTSGLAFYF
jgi:opacity protein-like surface antigen